MSLDLNLLVTEFNKVVAVFKDPKATVLMKALAVFDFVTTLRNQLAPGVSGVNAAGKIDWQKIIQLILTLLPLFIKKP